MSQTDATDDRLLRYPNISQLYRPGVFRREETRADR